MRAILTLLILAVVVAIVLIMTGVIDIDQTQEARLPAYDIDTPEVDVGTETREIEVPTIDVQSADEAEVDEPRNAQ